MIQDPDVKVSILTTAYNHERYITQAVESVMAQETDFFYDHVIGEDCSTDRTREILLELHSRHPDRIRLLLRDRNIGGRANFIDTFHACRGQYIAILEGDDYWSSPHKLQRQVNLLDSHPEFAICFHPVVKYFQAEDREKLFVPPREKDHYQLVDLLEQNFIATCSVMFRNHLFADFPGWFWHVPAGDLPLHVLNAEHGDIGYIDEVMAVHRIHPGGVWSHRSSLLRLQDRLIIHQYLKNHLGKNHTDRMNDTLATIHLKLIRAYSLDRKWASLVRHVLQLPLRSGLPLRSFVRAARGAFRNQVESGE
jgi:glycosyltransferase involved in cell wall biosynthesis